MKIPVIILFAPTATGKTALALNIFGHSSHSFFKDKAELISADSMQVYKHLNIGTAKPSVLEMAELKHHLVDVLEPSEQFTVADFVSSADKICNEIYLRKKIPLVAGGTGFYIRNFILGLPKTPISDEKIRNELKNRLKTEGKEVLYSELMRVDSESAKKININDEYRICRALEVFYTTGKPRSFFKMNVEPRKEYNFCIIILERERQELYERINARVEKMFSDGLKEEVYWLYKNGFTKEMPGMQAIGYKEWFLPDGTLRSDTEKVLEEIKHNSRKYAKKQYTFMKDIPNAIRINVNDEKQAEKEIIEYLKKAGVAGGV